MMPDCKLDQELLDEAYDNMDAAEAACEDAYLLWQIAGLLYGDCHAQWEHEMFETDIPVDDVIECGQPFGAKLSAEQAWSSACDAAFQARIDASHSYASLRDCKNGHKFRNITVWDTPGP